MCQQYELFTVLLLISLPSHMLGADVEEMCQMIWGIRRTSSGITYFGEICGWKLSIAGFPVLFSYALFIFTLLFLAGVLLEANSCSNFFSIVCLQWQLLTISHIGASCTNLYKTYPRTISIETWLKALCSVSTFHFSSGFRECLCA